MRRLLVVAVAGCTSSPLTGDGAEDLATLGAMVDVDCNLEPMCGPAPRCMVDARLGGQVGTVRRDVWHYVAGREELYPEHLFTYDGAVIEISDLSRSIENPRIVETRCAGVAAVAQADGCWHWGARACEY